jgi:hypothetical protein
MSQRENQTSSITAVAAAVVPATIKRITTATTTKFKRN